MTFRQRALPGHRFERNALFTMADSGASSASNFVLGSLVALRSEPQLYGRFALAFALYSLTFGIWRSWATEPYLLAKQKDTIRFAAVIGACAIVGTTALGLGGMLAALFQGDSRLLFLVVALCLPVLAAHDGVRFCLIGSQRAHLALVMDSAWLVLMLLGSFTIEGPAQLISWWGFSCAITLVVGLKLLDWPGARGGLRWLTQTSRVGLRFVFEFFLITGSNSFIMFAVGYSSGLAEMGAYRGAAVLVGPVAVVMTGLVTVVLNTTSNPNESQLSTPPELPDSSHARVLVHRKVKALTLLSFAVGAGWAVVVLITPDAVGKNILGETWASSRNVAIWFSIAIGGQAAILVTTAGYRLIERIQTGTRLKSIAMLAVTLSGALASYFGGASSAAAGFAAASTACGIVILLMFQREGPSGPESDSKPINVGLPLNKTEPLV